MKKGFDFKVPDKLPDEVPAQYQAATNEDIEYVPKFLRPLMDRRNNAALKNILNIAKETADNKTPVLVTQLSHELNCRSLPEEFSTILHERLHEKTAFILVMAKLLELNPELEVDKNFMQPLGLKKGRGTTLVVKFVYNAFKKELEEYKKKNKECLSQTISKAKGGVSRALFKLIKWDKTWLQREFVQKYIANNAQFDNRVFFENLADAIRKKSGGEKKAKEENILKPIGLLAGIYDLNKNNGLKKLHEDLDKNGVFDMGDETSNLSEYKYFTKQLRRHRII